MSPELETSPPPGLRMVVTEREDSMDGSSSLACENRTTAHPGSLGESGSTREDLSKDNAARAIGFQRTDSGITWMQQSKHRTDSSVADSQGEEFSHPDRSLHLSSRNAGQSSRLAQITGSTYHCGNLPDYLSHQSTGSYDRPPKLIADALFQNYLDTIHQSFPVVERTSFV